MLFVLGLRAGRNCSLETGSPGSDSASTGSDSPSLSALAGFPRQIPGPQVQRAQNPNTSTPSTVSSLSVMVNGGTHESQAPPPVPPRLPLGMMGNIHGQSPILENSFNSNHSVMSSPGQTQSTPVKGGTPMRKPMPAMSPALSPFQQMYSPSHGNQKVTISYNPKQLPNSQPPPPYTPSPGKPSVVIQGPAHLQQPNGGYILQVSSAERQDVRIQVNQQGKGQPVSAQSKNSQTIITQVVESTSVSRPQLQTATGPVFPQDKTGHHGNYVSSVQKMVNGPTQPNRSGQVQISVKNEHPGTEQIIFPCDTRHMDHSAFATANPNHLIHIKFSPQSHPYAQTQNEYGYTAISETLSTSRSGSPMSIATSGNRNQSPMSFSSSGTSDIPDHPPPPYPGPNRSQKIVIMPHNQSLVQPKPQTPLSMAYPVPKTQTVRSVPAGITRGVATPPEQPPLPPRVPLMKNPPPPPPQGKDESQPPVPPKDFLVTKQQNRPSPVCQIQNSEQNDIDTDIETVSNASDVSATENKRTCTSPIPERQPETEEKEILRRDSSVRNYSPAAYKFFMEQHVENLIKNYTQRQTRKLQLEKEMAKANLSEDAQEQMRRMLQQKESNYIRMKRSKMKKDMFEKITKLGVGAFGEVHLVQKKDVEQYYAMKTLRKMDVYKRNQVAHVKAERDILAEADNEWVVKLYYSFQDRDNLYFVMDYIPGGDLMGLLIRKEIFDQPLAQFYIAELVLAIESVHKMGFIHRDIKPDNILIDKYGHIKLTDFGLCTGFRWTHNSKYYQKGKFLNFASPVFLTKSLNLPLRFLSITMIQIRNP